MTLKFSASSTAKRASRGSFPGPLPRSGTSIFMIEPSISSGSTRTLRAGSHVLPDGPTLFAHPFAAGARPIHPNSLRRSIVDRLRRMRSEQLTDDRAAPFVMENIPKGVTGPVMTPTAPFFHRSIGLCEKNKSRAQRAASGGDGSPQERRDLGSNSPAPADPSSIAAVIPAFCPRPPAVEYLNLRNPKPTSRTPPPFNPRGSSAPPALLICAPPDGSDPGRAATRASPSKAPGTAPARIAVDGEFSKAYHRAYG